MTTRELLAVAVVAVPALTAAVLCARAAPSRSPRGDRRRATATGALALAVAALALSDPAHPVVGHWIVARRGRRRSSSASSGSSGSQACSSRRRTSRPRTARSSPAGGGERAYFVVLFAFWAILLAVPLAGNLGAAWLLVEATTAASALLVGFSGKPRALEAGWKYLILTSLGLGIALLGIVLLAAGRPRRRARRRSPGTRSRPTPAGQQAALIAYLLLLAGLAAKIGWAPVHNWLPDAHSEAPPPVSALLSAALLPAVLLVAWRSEQALAPVVGARHGAGGAARVRAALARGRGAVPLAAARLEAAARLLEPRAHGRDRARDRLRHPARARGRRDPHLRRTPSRRRSASTPPRRCSRTSRAPPATPSPASAAPSRALGDEHGHLARHARRACRPRRSSSARC